VRAAVEEDEIAGLYRRGYVGDSQVVAMHVMDADGNSEHIGIVRRRGSISSPGS
jgi:hypothetical protein